MTLTRASTNSDNADTSDCDVAGSVYAFDTSSYDCVYDTSAPTTLTHATAAHSLVG